MYILFIMKFIFFVVVSSALFASFETYNWGSRAVGMGGSFVSISDDASAPIWNPAGMSKIKNIEFMFSYSKPYIGLIDGVNIDKNFLSFVIPTKIIPVGFVWTKLSVGSAIKYSEDSVIISTGKKIEKLNLSLGVSVKYLGVKVVGDNNVDDPVIKNKGYTSALELDLGFLYFAKIYSKNFCFGLSTMLNEPDVGFSKVDVVKRKINFGVSMETNMPNFIIIPSISFLVYNNNFVPMLGCEFGINKNLVLRSGYNYTDLNFGFSYNFLIKVFGEIKIDYAYSLPLSLTDNSGSHNVSLVLKFDKSLKFKK